MADSFIQLPADGAGKELDTRTQPDGEHREVVVLGDPDTTDVVGASAANGLEVDVTRVQGSVTVADGGGSISVDDGGGTITVDGTVAVSGAVDTELPAAAVLADDTANPTAPAVGGFGMVYDGATWDRMPGTAADGVLVNLGANNDVVVSGTVSVTEPVSVDDNGGSLTVDGTVTVQDGGGSISVDDNGASLTVDNAALSVIGGGVEATALRVTIATDSTGVVSVDDNGGSLTVDGTVGVSGTVTVADGGGSLTVDDGGGALTVDGTVSVSGTVTTQGGAASDDPVAGNPNLSGGRASDATPTAVSTDGDAVSVWADLNGALRTNERRATGTPTEGAFTATTDTQILASSTTRKAFSIANDSDRILYVRYGPTAVTTTAYKVAVMPGGFFADDGWTGEVRGILSGAIGAGQVRYSAEA